MSGSNPSADTDASARGEAPRATGLRLHLPNVLSTMRLVLVPVFIAAMIADEGTGWVSFAVFAVAAWTDYFDGMLARRWNVQSAFGKIVDPMADRALIVSATALLAHFELLSWWAFVVVIARDVFVGIGFVLVRSRAHTEANVSQLGKWATATMMLGIGFLIMLDQPWAVWMFWIGAIMSVIAFFEYFRKYIGTVATPSTGAV